MSIFAQIFTWWNGQTIGTRLFTWRSGERVGEDEQGNVFYQNHDKKRRWVIYAGEAEASHVSPDWHGWLHHTFKEPPTVVAMSKNAWQKPHVPNLTGTTQAYRPSGSMLGETPKVRADYEAWSPE